MEHTVAAQPQDHHLNIQAAKRIPIIFVNWWRLLIRKHSSNGWMVNAHASAQKAQTMRMGIAAKTTSSGPIIVANRPLDYTRTATRFHLFLQIRSDKYFSQLEYECTGGSYGQLVNGECLCVCKKGWDYNDGGCCRAGLTFNHVALRCEPTGGPSPAPAPSPGCDTVSLLDVNSNFMR